MSTNAYPPVTDADFDNSVTIGSGQYTNGVSPYDCAMPGIATALQGYLNTKFAGVLAVAQVLMWPLYNQDVQANNPFKQSKQVPGYVITTADGKTLLDYTLAGPLVRYAQQFSEQVFDNLIIMWYGPGGTAYQPGGFAFMQQQDSDTVNQEIQKLLQNGTVA